MESLKPRFFLVGIVAICLSIMFFCSKLGQSFDKCSYSGDFYTDMQQTAADVGNSINNLTRVIKNGIGSILLIKGVTLIAVSFYKKDE